jgi:hypothetical protein
VGERAARARETTELQRQRDALTAATSERKRDADAITRAASDRQRCEAIMHAPESLGRERFSSYLAYETDKTVAEARAALAAAAYEPGSMPALALEAQAIADRIVGKSRNKPTA